MAAPDVRGIIQAGYAVLTTYVEQKTKKILAQLGDVRGETDTDNAEWVQHVGLASRPSKPDKGKAAAYAVVVRGGDRDVVIASVDERGLELYGNLDFGETCLYAAGEDGKAQGRILIKKNGSISLYTKAGNTSGGKGMVLQLDAENDAIRLTNGKGYGLIIDADGVTLTTGGDKAALVLGADGAASLIGTGPATVDGAHIKLGALAAVGVNNVVTGVTGISGVGSGKVFAQTA